MEIVEALNAFAAKRLSNDEKLGLEPTYYDLSDASGPLFGGPKHKFEVIAIDLSYLMFRKAFSAVTGIDVLKRLQSMVVEDAACLDTRVHIFCLDERDAVWNAKRVEQSERRDKTEPYVEFVELRAVTAGVGAGARVLIENYVFGLDVPMPADFVRMRATHRLYEKFCVFVGDLVHNHLLPPYPDTREHSFVFNGCRFSSGSNSALRETHTRFVPFQNTQPPGNAEPEQRPIVWGSERREQTARSRHVSPLATSQSSCDTLGIGEAEAQCVAYAINPAAYGNEAKSFLVRTSDTDSVALALLAIQHMVRRLGPHEELDRRFYIDLSTTDEKKRFVDVIALWRQLCDALAWVRQTVSLSLSKPSAGQSSLVNGIEWLILLLNLTGNDFCVPMSNLTVKKLFCHIEALFGSICRATNPPLLICNQTGDLVADEEFILRYVVKCLRNIKAIDTALRKLKLLAAPERAQLDVLARELPDGKLNKAGGKSSDVWVADYERTMCHIRRALSCLHMQYNVIVPGRKFVDAYKFGPTLNGNPVRSLYGYERDASGRYVFARAVTPVAAEPYPWLLTRKRKERSEEQEAPANVAKVPKKTAEHREKLRKLDPADVESIENSDDGGAALTTQTLPPPPSQPPTATSVKAMSDKLSKQREVLGVTTENWRDSFVYQNARIDDRSREIHNRS